MTVPPPAAYAAPPPGYRMPSPGYPYPQPVGPPPGYAPAPAVRHTSHLLLIGLLALTLALVAGVVVGVSAALTPTVTTTTCPPTCGVPPRVAKPISKRPRFVAANKSFSVEYDTATSNQAVDTAAKVESDGVTEQLSSNTGGGTVVLFGTPAGGRTAQQVAAALISKSFPSARRVYVIQNAFVGYRLGYGEADDVQIQSSNGAATTQRLTVLVAVKNNVALVGESLAPYRPFRGDGSPPSDGHPTAAGSVAAVFVLDPLVNTFMWAGDPPR